MNKKSRGKARLRRAGWPMLGLAAFLAAVPPCACGQASGGSYDVRIEGLPSQALLDQLTQISNSVALKDRPPASPSLLRKRVDDDIARFTRWLRAQGYFGLRIEATVDEAAKPATVTFKVDTGPVFLLRSLDVQVLGQIETEIPGLGLKGVDPFSASSLALAQETLIRHFTSRGFPFARIADRRIVVDHADQSVSVTVLLDPGLEAWFGPTRISGLVEVDEEVVRRTLPWKEGQSFNAELLEEGRRKLASLGLFSVVRALPEQGLEDQGRLPVSIVVTERKHRSVELGLSYRTDEGLGVKASWENRNLFQGGERLAFSGTFSDFTRSAEGGYLEPFFLRQDQNLRLSSRLADDRPDAYSSRNLRSDAGVERSVTEALKVGAGLGFKVSKVTRLSETNRYTFLSLPLTMEYNGSDDPLDPTRGWTRTPAERLYLEGSGEIRFPESSTILETRFEIKDLYPLSSLEWLEGWSARGRADVTWNAASGALSSKGQGTITPSGAFAFSSKAKEILFFVTASLENETLLTVSGLELAVPWATLRGEGNWDLDQDTLKATGLLVLPALDVFSSRLKGGPAEVSATVQGPLTALTLSAEAVARDVGLSGLALATHTYPSLPNWAP